MDCPLRDACAWNLAGAPAPDPGAAAVRRPQQRFTESDRYHRGRLLDALRAGPLAHDDLPAAARTADAPRARRLADALVSEGLAEWSLGTLTLPERRPEGSG
jgi:A/G-specific adenine glycosylase